ncbi:MAG: transposase [Candidatus Omnitrophota bacterium]|nr:transposase [Candidatus Omnitrophota bacterium]
MPRQARIVIPHTAHHITQRGNYRQNVFDKERDYKQYCEWINEYAQETGLDILAYCLMKNHVHFIVVPKQESDMAAVFKTTHMRYAHYINRQRKAKGHLWQGRFYSCILEDTHLYRAIRYVENNPLRAKIVKCAEDYEYSSAKDHAKERDKPFIKLTEHKDIKSGKQWQDYLREDDPYMTQEIRLKTSRGLVIGSVRFLSKLEKLLNRSLRCLSQGRPRKKA